MAAAGLERFEAVQPHMGTLVRIQLYAADAGVAREGFRAAFARIAELDAALSDYKEDSEINRLCRVPAGKAVKVSADLFAVLAASLQVAEQSNGAFDVTLGPVTLLWREARRQRRLPSPAALHDALEHGGLPKLQLDAASRSVTLEQAGMHLDLGGIAKGYTADAALAALAGLGISRALVAMSGDLAIGDSPPDRKGWEIGVVTSGGGKRSLSLCNAAVSTSGDAEQFLEAGDSRYSHLIDPTSGMGLTRAITVTVIARRGVDADAWSTAVSVLGVEAGMVAIAKVPGMVARITRGAGPLAEVVESPGWGELGCRPR